MWIVAGAIIIGQMIVAGVSLFVIKWYVARQLTYYAQLWLESPAEGQPSQLGELAARLGSVVGSAAATTLTAQLHAEQAAVARQANKAADEITAQQNPLMALVAGRRAGKGAAVARLVEMLGPMLLGQLGINKGDNGAGTPSVRERLQKGS